MKKSLALIILLITAGLLLAGCFRNQKPLPTDRQLYVKGRGGELRSGPGRSFEVISELEPGTFLDPLEQVGNWYKVKVLGDIVTIANHSSSGDETVNSQALEGWVEEQIITNRGALAKELGRKRKYAVSPPALGNQSPSYDDPRNRKQRR